MLLMVVDVVLLFLIYFLLCNNYVDYFCLCFVRLFRQDTVRIRIYKISASIEIGSVFTQQ